MSDLCPCGSKTDFEQCCEPYLIARARPATAEALMRSRYSAYAMGSVDYLYKTSGPRIRADFDAEGMRKWSESAEWSGIEFLDKQGGGENDTTATLEFIAHYAVNGVDYEHHERATFEKRGGHWFFMDCKLFGPDPIRREHPKIGRNDPCPCGSGKKHKKCCFKNKT